MKPHLVLVSGFPRSGKTTLTRFFENQLGFARTSLDEVSEELHGWKDLSHKETDPRWKEKKKEALDAVRQNIWSALREGKSIVVDAAASHERKRDWFFQVPKDVGDVEKILIVLTTDPETLTQRGREAGRTNDAVASWSNYWEEPSGEGYRIIPLESSTLQDLETNMQICREMFAPTRHLEGNLILNRERER